jgi:hypothetical protein
VGARVWHTHTHQSGSNFVDSVTRSEERSVTISQRSVALGLGAMARDTVVMKQRERHLGSRNRRAVRDTARHPVTTAGRLRASEKADTSARVSSRQRESTHQLRARIRECGSAISQRGVTIGLTKHSTRESHDCAPGSRSTSQARRCTPVGVWRRQVQHRDFSTRLHDPPAIPARTSQQKRRQSKE